MIRLIKKYYQRFAWWRLKFKIESFIQAHGQGHITRSAREFYSRNWTTAEVYCVMRYHQSRLVGAGLMAIDRERRRVTQVIVVVHRDYRKRGIGADIMREKIEKAREMCLEFLVYVAEDNHASRGMLRKAGVTQQVSQSMQTRQGGRYRRLRLRAN